MKWRCARVEFWSRASGHNWQACATAASRALPPVKQSVKYGHEPWPRVECQWHSAIWFRRPVIWSPFRSLGFGLQLRFSFAVALLSLPPTVEMNPNKQEQHKNLAAVTTGGIGALTRNGGNNNWCCDSLAGEQREWMVKTCNYCVIKMEFCIFLPLERARKGRSDKTSAEW